MAKFGTYTFIALLWFGNSSLNKQDHISMDLGSHKSENFTQKKNHEFYSQKKISLNADRTYHLELGQLYTAIKISSNDTNQSLVHLFTNEREYVLETKNSDPNIDIPLSFIVFGDATHKLTIRSTHNTIATIELFYTPPIQTVSVAKRKKSSNCEKPVTIQQNEWRQGLPTPAPGRQATIVKHCIVHHSAGNNTDTNYTNMVRNIYLLHTHSNGWSDIGYNYLIAPDGSIYNGRDSENVADEDNIQGAHFCGKNGGTMGICLLGNYNLIKPSQATQGSLVDLLSWKLHKENLQTTESFKHPNSLGENLPTIAMHQNGCATECPGDSTVKILNSLRTAVQQNLDNCGESVVIKKPQKKYKLLVYPNPSKGKFYVMIEKEAYCNSYKIINSIGQVVIQDKLTVNGLIATQIANGKYTLELYNHKTKVGVQKLVIKR